MLKLMLLAVLLSAYSVVVSHAAGYGAAADSTSSALDKLLFQSFCERQSVKTILGMCFTPATPCQTCLATAAKDTNKIRTPGTDGTDVYSTASTGSVSKPFESNGIPVSFVIFAKEPIQVTCSTSFVYSTTYNIALNPIEPSEQQLNIMAHGNTDATGAFTLKGTFKKGVAIASSYQKAYICNWKPITS